MSSSIEANAQACLPYFARGTLAILDVWPAFRLAQQNNWIASSSSSDDPPETSAAKRQRLAEEIVDAFFSDPAQGPDSSSLEDFFVEFFEGELSVMLEDGSEINVTKDLKALWSECMKRTESGMWETDANGTLEKLEVMAEKARAEDKDPERKPLATRQGDSDDDYTSDEGDDTEMRNTENQPREKQEPVVDDDGFTLVQKKR